MRERGKKKREKDIYVRESGEREKKGEKDV